MSKIPKLYIKNEKGKYEEYKGIDMDVSETLFRRINGRYVPQSVMCTNDLPEGVWVVTRSSSAREYIAGQYLKEVMNIEKASDLEEMPNLAELGGWQKCAKWVLENVGDITKMTKNEVVYAIVGKVFEYSKISNNENKVGKIE